MWRTLNHTLWWIRITCTVTVWLIAEPFRLARWAFYTTGRLCGFCTLLRHDALPCPGCGKAVSLVGRWQCACGYVYDGHGLAPCPVCGDVPPYLPCRRCGVGIKNPIY